MHQHQLLALTSKIEFLDATPPLKARSFTDDEYGTLYSFLTSRQSAQQLTATQLKHLRNHYITVFSISNRHDLELDNMEQSVQIWLRCRVDKTIFHCERYRRQSSTRLNHLACREQMVDANQNYSYRSRPEHMVPAKFYAYIQFYCVHLFRGTYQMLMYSSYRKTEVHDGLVEDKGPLYDGFQDIRVLQHLCAKVKGHGGKIYFVDAPKVMEERLREDLLE